MIEQAVYFALGFLVAALLALGILPAFWRRAYRLTRREIEATLPLSPREIAAERDQLRARFAVERVQLEQKVEAAEAARHGSMALAGERTTAIQKLDEELAARRQEIASLEGRVRELEGTLSATREQLAGTETSRAEVRGALADLQERHAALERARAELQDVSDQRRVEIAAQKTNLEAQRARIEEIDAALKVARAETRARGEELRETQRRLRELETDLSVAQSRYASMEETAERRAQVIAERDAAIADMRQAGASQAVAMKQLESEAQSAKRRVEGIERAAAEREQAVSRIGEEAKTTIADLSRSVDRLRGERDALREALATARAEAARLRRDLAAAGRGARAGPKEAMTKDLKAKDLRKSVAPD